jgi:hypothetical protein
MAVAVYLCLSEISGSDSNEYVDVSRTTRRNIPEDGHLESVYILSSDGDR